MKKVVLIASVAMLSIGVTSCGTSGNTLTNTVNTIKTVQKISNVAGTAKEIVGVLSPVLGLNTNQNTSLLNVVTKHITGTNGIASLATSNVAEYAAKLAGVNTSTLGSLKTIMSATQYTKLLGLGGGGSSSLLNSLGGGNAGSKISSDAVSVLSGLLLK